MRVRVRRRAGRAAAGGRRHRRRGRSCRRRARASAACAARGEQPVQVAGGVAHRERRPADDRAHRVAVDEDRVGRERAVDDRRPEPPERVVVGRLLPPAQDRRGQAAGVGGAADELDDGVARLVGRLAGQPGVGDETARQRVDRRDREPTEAARPSCSVSSSAVRTAPGRNSVTIARVPSMGAWPTKPGTRTAAVSGCRASSRGSRRGRRTARSRRSASAARGSRGGVRRRSGARRRRSRRGCGACALGPRAPRVRAPPPWPTRLE